MDSAVWYGSSFSAHTMQTHHFARGEDEGCGFGLPDAHNHGRKPFWIVFRVTGSHRDFLQLELASQIDGCDNVL